MKKILITIGIALAVVLGLLAAAPSQAEPSSDQDPVVSYHTEVDVTVYDNHGKQVSEQHIKSPEVPIGTPLTITPNSVQVAERKPIPNRLYGGGIGGGFSGNSGCTTLTVHNVSKTLLGFTAFKFNTSVYWCWNKTTNKVAVGSVSAWPSNVDSQYSYAGVITAWTQVHADWKRIYRQARFNNCVIKYGCIASFYPANDHSIYDTGAWAWVTSG